MTTFMGCTDIHIYVYIYIYILDDKDLAMIQVGIISNHRVSKKSGYNLQDGINHVTSDI